MISRMISEGSPGVEGASNEEAWKGRITLVENDEKGEVGNKGEAVL